MGQTVLCDCGQRNDLTVFGFGEPRICHACGRPLSPPEGHFVEDSFTPEVPSDAFLDSGSPPAGSTAAFESPGPAETPAGAPEPGMVSSQRGIWSGGVREPESAAAAEACARCNRPFRGEWDQHETEEGVLCHLCASRADATYQAPSMAERRELYRAEPPKPAAAPDGEARNTEEAAERRRGLKMIAIAGVVTVAIVVILPVEVWIARGFSADPERAQSLPAVWKWVVHILGFATSAVGQGVVLYVTLAMMDMLFGDREEDIKSVAFLGVAFAIIDLAIGFVGSILVMFGPLVIGLVIVGFYFKLSLINRHFSLNLENAIGFVLAWFVCSLLLAPALRMVEWGLGAMIAAIVL